MSKFFNKWMRVFHRWVAFPTLILIPLAVYAKFTGGKEVVPMPLEQLQSVLMLLLAVSGAYLYLIPYLAKWQRQRRKARAVTRTTTSTFRRPS